MYKRGSHNVLIWSARRTWKGSFWKSKSFKSKVLKVFDHKDKEDLALKILKAEDQFNEQGLNEISVLRSIKEIGGASGRNIIEYWENFVFWNHIVSSNLK